MQNRIWGFRSLNRRAHRWLAEPDRHLLRYETTTFMPKYLRYISWDMTDEDGRPDKALWTVVRSAPEVWHLAWMYEHFACPMRTDGVAKVNVFLTAAEPNREPSEVLSIANVYGGFDAAHFQSLAPKGRQAYYLERLHQALLRCAEQFGWDAGPLSEAYRRILKADFEFAFFWKKPLASPDRRWKVQAFAQVSPLPAHLYLVFFDRKLQEQRRTLLSVGTDGPGPVEFALGNIRWQDSDTLRVENKNGRDYWLCTTDGGSEFHYPRAEAGDPHGEYDLGRMYYDGQWVLQDKDRGLDLIKTAAAKGYRHAQRFLARESPNSGGQ